MRRSLIAIFDPPPSKSEVDELWNYFEFRCAYCGKPISRETRTGHIDHLVPSADGGSNNIHNHALSCARCNGDEKREEPWQPFLESKTENVKVLQARKEKIDHWLSLISAKNNDPELVADVESIIKEAIENFDRSVAKMRALRTNRT